MNVLAALERLGIEHTVSRGEAQAHCPAHEDRTGHEDRNPSWSINIDTGVHHCFSCGWKGGLSSVVAQVRGVDRAEASRWIEEERPVREVDELRRTMERVRTRQLRVIRSAPVDEALYRSFSDPTPEMLSSRGITEDSAWFFGLKRRDLDTWVLPITDEYGHLIGWQEKAGPIVRNRPTGVKKGSSLFGLGLVSGDEVTVVESPLDAVRAHSYGMPPTVALFGSHPSQDQAHLLSRFRRVVLALDNDEAGRKGQLILANMLTKLGVFPHELVWPLGVTDFGDCTPEQLRQGFTSENRARRILREVRKRSRKW